MEELHGRRRLVEGPGSVRRPQLTGEQQQPGPDPLAPGALQSGHGPGHQGGVVGQQLPELAIDLVRGAEQPPQRHSPNLGEQQRSGPGQAAPQPPPAGLAVGGQPGRTRAGQAAGGQELSGGAIGVPETGQLCPSRAQAVGEGGLDVDVGVPGDGLGGLGQAVVPGQRRQSQWLLAEGCRAVPTKGPFGQLRRRRHVNRPSSLQPPWPGSSEGETGRQPQLGVRAGQSLPPGKVGHHLRGPVLGAGELRAWALPGWLPTILPQRPQGQRRAGHE